MHALLRSHFSHWNSILLLLQLSIQFGLEDKKRNNLFHLVFISLCNCENVSRDSKNELINHLVWAHEWIGMHQRDGFNETSLMQVLSFFLSLILI